MSCVLVLLSFIVLSGDGIISEGASRPHVVNVGAIFGLNTLHGKVANIAMKAAEDDVNSDPSFLGGSKLRILMNDAKRSGFLSIIGGENTVSTLGRVVLLIWLFVVLIITSSYTASLTSILTVQQLNSPIKGVDTLMSSSERVGFQVGSYAENYMIDELNIARSRLVALGSPKEYATALQNGTVSAIVDERPYVDLFLSEFCGFAIRGQAFTRSGWGFAFPRDSPLAVDMSTAILGLSETGQLQKIREKWLSKSNCSNLNGSHSDDDQEQLGLHSFWGLFLMCGVACFIALLIYFFKIVRDFCNDHKPLEEAIVPSPESSHSNTLHTFLAYFDAKEDKTKRRLKRKRNHDLSVKFPRTM